MDELDDRFNPVVRMPPVSETKLRYLPVAEFEQMQREAEAWNKVREVASIWGDDAETLLVASGALAQKGEHSAALYIRAIADALEAETHCGHDRAAIVSGSEGD